METVRAALNAVSERLHDITETPRFEAELLLTHHLGWSRAKLLADLDSPMDIAALDPLVARRLNHEPIAYILGTWEFYSLELDTELRKKPRQIAGRA